MYILNQINFQCLFKETYLNYQNYLLSTYVFSLTERKQMNAINQFHCVAGTNYCCKAIHNTCCQKCFIKCSPYQKTFQVTYVVLMICIFYGVYKIIA
jgi:hypothetical protein